jgi:hypothetical protein
MPIQKIGIGSGVEESKLYIKEACLEAEYQVTEPNLIAARFSLCQGRLYTRDFLGSVLAGEEVKTVCAFCQESDGTTKPDPYHSQMVSIQVTYEPNLDQGQPLKITSWRYGGGCGDTKKFPGFLFKNPDKEGRDIVLNIWNAPFADILDLLGGKDKHNWPRPQGERSFRSYFRLCEEAPAKLPTLTPNNRIAASYQTLAGSSDKKDVGCPTGRFSKPKRYS